MRIAATFLAASLLAGGSHAQQKHWAYVAPARPELPKVARVDWPRNAIDAFVLARLERARRSPSDQAEPARLIRRLYLDLIGLPPSAEEVDAFLVDPSDAAFEKTVDRLLASPRLGEHWARPWLDLARYADSNGFQADQLRDSWAYRDWVIDAINADMPFDRFTVEQLAGDLLPKPTLQQKIATGFHRTVPCNVEAGVHPEENRVNQVFDRVNTTATVWLGTTMECAQCHDHKYDPFSQREYYELFAFFNNTPIEVANPSGKGVRFDFIGPRLDLPFTDAQRKRRTELRHQLDAIDAPGKNAAKRQPDARGAAWHVLDVAKFASTGDEDHEVLADGSVLVGGRLPGTSTYTIDVWSRQPRITALRIETLTHPSLPGKGPGRGDDARPNFILSELTVHAELPGMKPRKLELYAPSADHSQKGWHVSKAIDGNPRTGWAIGGGGFFKDHRATFRLRQPLRGRIKLRLTLDQNFGRGRTIGRVRVSAFSGEEAALSREEKRRAERRALQAKLAAIRPHSTLVMVEGESRPTHVLHRGSYLDRGERVTPRTPRTLHAWREEWPRNRLGLAQWIVDSRNPLTARVTVNRWWARIFGHGLVESEEDFGVRARKPSHPLLLDWLATELVASGWSRKRVLRAIVTSSTYRQSSRRRTPHDPRNRTHGRGPRLRMPAEMIRDNALRIAGLLSTKMGGPPTFPPQPPGLWRQTGRNEPKYVVADGEDRFRRGVYVIWRRAAPYPSFVLFDGPDRAVCHPRRSRTNTPMQALALLNDQSIVEAALGFAQRILRARSSIAERVEFAFRTALARRPTRAERVVLEEAYGREHTRLQNDPRKVAELLSASQAVPIERTLDRAEIAAWLHIATVLLNLDETITKS